MAADTGLEHQLHSGGNGQGASGAQGIPNNPGLGGQASIFNHQIGGSASTDNTGSNHLADYFTVGMIVELRTLYNKVLKGEVVAFDLTTKMLAIKCRASSGRPNLNDVQVVNLSFVDDIKVTREAVNKSPPPLPNLNYPKLKSRIAQSVVERKQKLSYAGIGVTPLAQNLVYAITKTITEVRWNQQDIIVLDQVVISPPYDVENCQLIDRRANQTQALHHVQKLVGKFHKENNSSSNDSSTSTTSK